MTTRSEIKGMIERVSERGDVTHVIIVCDTFDHDDYPVPVMRGEDPREVAEARDGRNMQKVMEVYSLTGVHSIESQLAEERAFHYD